MYAEQNALLLPGRVPGYSRTDLKLLPSSTSKRGIWRVYSAASENSNTYTVAYSTFCKLWKTLIPSIILMKLMSDLCWQCQQNSSAILRAVNQPDSEKSDTIRAAEEHILIVQKERLFYRTTCEDCKASIRDFFTYAGEFTPPLHSCFPPNSNNLKAHYAFDYAQQVHFPSDPMQPGPVYFLTPRKCAIFGVNLEAIPRQVNFLTDEAGCCGKGSNAVVSQLHYFFEHHGLGETEVFLHADNCSGQNKNSTMIHYLAWRALTNQHSSLTLSFLIVGHTKFSPDWCFGLFKRKFRHTKVSTLNGIACTVNESAHCNHAQLVSREDGSVIVPTYDWADFFASRFKKVPGIKKLHHFRFSSSEPGCVFMKEYCDSDVEVKVELLKFPWSPDSLELPRIIVPKVLSTTRQWYLYDQIRQFCADDDKDITCLLTFYQLQLLVALILILT